MGQPEYIDYKKHFIFYRAKGKVQLGVLNFAAPLFGWFFLPSILPSSIAEIN